MAQFPQLKLNRLILKTIPILTIGLWSCQGSADVATRNSSASQLAVAATPLTTPVAQTSSFSYPRRRAVLTDLAKPGTSFWEFRESLRRAVQERHAEYIRAIASPQIKLSFGRPIGLESLDLDNPNSLFWQHLDRIINTGCAPFEGSPEIVASANAQVWICPHVFQAVQINDPYQDVFIVGKDINVRSQPNLNSAVIAVVSNEVVQNDPNGYQALSEGQRRNLETVQGWRPIITPSGKRGFVSSRYAFSPIGYRAYFVNEGNGWYMTVFIAGD